MRDAQMPTHLSQHLFKMQAADGEAVGEKGLCMTLSETQHGTHAPINLTAA